LSLEEKQGALRSELEVVAARRHALQCEAEDAVAGRRLAEAQRNEVSSFVFCKFIFFL